MIAKHNYKIIDLGQKVLPQWNYPILDRLKAAYLTIMYINICTLVTDH
jgi:hypothetical protein